MAEKKKTVLDISSIINGPCFGVIFTDRDLKVLWLNTAMERLFGISRDAIIGQDIFTFFNSHIAPRILDGEPIVEQILNSFASGTPIPKTEVRLSSPTEQPIWIEYLSQVIEHGPSNGMRLDIYQDITPRVVLQREIDRHAEDLGDLIEWITTENPPANEQFREDKNEKKRIEEHLLKERRFSEQLLDTLPIYLLSLDNEGTILIIGNSLLHALGLEKESFLGKPFFSTFIIPEEKEQAFRRFRRSVESRTETEDEVHIQTKDGQVITVEWRYKPIFREDGSIAYILSVGTDITKKETILESLRTSEDLYRTIFENTSAATAILNEDFSIFRSNTELAKITGYSTEELVGKRLTDLLSSDDRRRISPHSPHRQSCECHIIRNDGQIRQAFIDLVPIPSGKRNVVSFHDITDRKQAEQQLADQNRFLSIVNQMFNAATSSQNLQSNLTALLQKVLELLILDAGAVYIVERNGTSARLTAQHGMPEWMTGGAQSLDIRKSPYRSTFIEGHTEFLEKKEIGLLSIAWIPFFADSKVIGAVFFMSGRKDAFSESERLILESLSHEVGNVIQCSILKEEVVEANTLSNFYLDLMSHDINNANQISQMYAGLLVEMLDGERKDMAEKTKAAIDRIIEIISNVSTLRKIREEKAMLQSISLDGTITRVMKGFPDAHITYASSGLTVCADPLLSEVFANLIGNSLKFGGKTVNISIYATDLRELVEVAVSDNGPGIPDSVKPLLFRKFERGQTKVRGKGLGLYLCSVLMERYGGKIRIEDRVPSHSEEGVVFKFQLKKEPCGE